MVVPVVVPVVPVEPVFVVVFVLCAFAPKAMPATSMQPKTIDFFIVECFKYLLFYYLTLVIKICLKFSFSVPYTV